MRSLADRRRVHMRSAEEAANARPAATMVTGLQPRGGVCARRRVTARRRWISGGGILVEGSGSVRIPLDAVAGAPPACVQVPRPAASTSAISDRCSRHATRRRDSWHAIRTDRVHNSAVESAKNVVLAMTNDSCSPSRASGSFFVFLHFPTPGSSASSPLHLETDPAPETLPARRARKPLMDARAPHVITVPALHVGDERRFERANARDDGHGLSLALASQKAIHRLGPR